MTVDASVAGYQSALVDHDDVAVHQSVAGLVQSAVVDHHVAVDQSAVVDHHDVAVDQSVAERDAPVVDQQAARQHGAMLVSVAECH